MTRSAVQLLEVNKSMYALCDDGSVWKHYPGVTCYNLTGQRPDKVVLEEATWVRVIGIPQGD